MFIDAASHYAVDSLPRHIYTAGRALILLIILTQRCNISGYYMRDDASFDKTWFL